MNRTKKTIHIAFLAIFILAAGGAAFLSYRNFEQKRDAYYARLQDELNTAYGVTTFANQETARIVFNTYINKPEILELYKQANSADEALRNAVRRQLLEKFGPLYERLKARYVKQFMFFLPDSEVVFRFHRPQNYGDSVKGVRYSVDKANAELVAVSGFEEGRLINSFRNVFPLVYNGEHLGSVEISMGFDDIRERMEQQFHNRYAFMVRRRLVEEKVFADEQKNYQPGDLSDDYLYERTYAADDMLQVINAVLKPKIQERLKAGEAFAMEAKAPDAARLVVFFPVKNIQGQQAAYIVSYNDDATIHSYYWEFVIALAISIVGILVIVLLIYLLANALGLTRANEERLEMVLKGAGLGMWDWHIPTGEVVFNERWAQMLGYTLDEIEPNVSSWEKLMHPDEIETVTATLTDHLEGRSPVYQTEHRLRAKSGEWKWILDTGKVLERDKDGKPVRMLGIHQDITERKKAEESLRSSEKFLQDMFDAIQDGISVLDTDLNVISTNRWMEKTHANQMPLAGKKCYQVYQQRQSPCPWCPALPSIETGETHSEIVPYPSEDNPTGWIELFTFPIKDEKGHVTGVIEYVKDITERKRAEQQLHNEREKLFVTMQSIGDGVITTDTEGRVTFIN
ncbi:MAG: PAS domain S-box protein, partial [Pseudomonadota bacterium]|nr:PAS domain S-box protein [Pseudomonadota bacterium]